MTAHTLQSRTDNEVLWWQRRDMITAAAAWVAMGGAPSALAQQRSNVVQLTGRALLNGRSLLPGQSIQTGDEIRTGPGSLLVFTLGSTAFLVRQNTLMTVERGNTLNTVSVLRLLSGAVAQCVGQGQLPHGSHAHAHGRYPRNRRVCGSQAAGKQSHLFL